VDKVFIRPVMKDVLLSKYGTVIILKDYLLVRTGCVCMCVCVYVCIR